MKIAIVAPCAIPYVVGGAEKLWWGLASHLNDRTPHQCEIIKLPSPEHDLLSLVRSYEAFAQLDLKAFDVVISGKYPAWMVEHPNHVCYMLHRLRGLYDCYPGSVELPPELAAHPTVNALRAFMQRNVGARSALPEFFGRWNEIVAGGWRPAGLLDFPGPLSREIVHWLDGIALSTTAIRHYAAISRTVAERPGYFPEGVEVAVAYPPPHRAMAPGSGRKHFYTVSRLDGPKRVGAIVEAYRKVRGNVPLVIGGSGPEEAKLRELAAGDPRIVFAGYQSDEEVREHYRDSLAVPFVPWQEDYGLIAVEAMQCAKPVVTFVDAGGPTELVHDGLSGYVVENTVDALAGALQKFVDDPSLSARMGEQALKDAAAITWDRVSEVLLAAPKRAASVAGAAKHKLLVTSTYAIYPPRMGGASRSFHIYRALAPEFETTIVSVCAAHEPAFEGEIAPGVREIRIPKSAEHERREKEIEEKIGYPVTDVVMPELYTLTPALVAALERVGANASVGVASHPYFYPALRKMGLPIWYEAQDYEYKLKQKLLKGKEGGDALLESVRVVEDECVHASDAILCASYQEAEEISKSLGIPIDPFLDVPNGTDAWRIPYTPPEERAALKERMGFADKPVAFFMGSGHWPNIEAVQCMFKYAVEMPEVVFAVMGNVCYAFDPTIKPVNVLFLGEVDDVTRGLCLQAFDVALNPMLNGSGTNLKMLDYFACGMPVVTSPVGGRGLALEDGKCALVSEIDDFPAAIRDVVGEGHAAALERAAFARRRVEEEFDWDAIVGRIKPRLLELARGYAGVAPEPAPAPKEIPMEAAKTFTAPTDHEAVRQLMEEQKALFDQHKAEAAKHGVDLMHERIVRYLATWREVMAYVPDGRKILDVGPGWVPPQLFDLILKELKVDYHAMDIEPNYLTDLAKRCEAEGLGIPADHFRQGEGSVFPFDEKFDLVFSSHCLEHSVDIVATLKEVRRVLKDGCCLFMCVPLGFDLSDEHLLFHGPQEWSAMITAMGLEVIKCTLGEIYAGSELVIIARYKSSMPVDEAAARAIAQRFAKVGKTFIRHDNAAFTFPAGTMRQPDCAILDGVGSSFRMTLPADPAALVVLQHDWSGSLLISDGRKRLAVDTFHVRPHLAGIDLTGFGRDITVEVVGRNNLSHADRAIVAGVLVQKG